MKKIPRCKRAIRHAYAGPPARRWCGFMQAKVYGVVLRCYDEGVQANGPAGNRWDRWAAGCRGD